MLTVKQLTPMILSEDFEASLAFYTSLGFTVGFRGREPDYAYLTCNGRPFACCRRGQTWT